MIRLLVALLAQLAQAQQPAASAPAAPDTARGPAGMRVQMGLQVRPDTVTVGERFLVLLRVRTIPGATVEFPEGPRPATVSSVTAPMVVAGPVLDSATDSTGITRTAAYRFTAWDTGEQQLGFGPVIVASGDRAAAIPLATATVFVRSVLPADTTQRVPRPPRPLMQLASFPWMLLAALLAAALLALLAWWLWRRYRLRRDAPLAPFDEAEREFARIEAMQLLRTADSGLYVAMMTDVVRRYLARRVSGVRHSQTSAELLSSAAPVRSSAPGLSMLLEKADLVKFARARISTEAAEELGREARAIVRSVEDHFLAREREESSRAAA